MHCHQEFPYGVNNHTDQCQSQTSQARETHRQFRLSQAIQLNVNQLEKLNQLKDDFLSTISHELRTPLANMKLGLQMLEYALSRDENRAIEQSSKADYYLKLVQDACEQEIHLVNDLLALQQLEAGTYPILLNTVPLRNWLMHLIEAFEVEALKQNQWVQINLDNDLPWLVCDLSVLDRVMQELLTNACKFTPAGGEITVTAQATAAVIQIRVVNSGIEIPTDELARVFDKFYRLPSDDPWQHSGTGLGLALVKGLVTHLGGVIHVTSADNQVCFVVELPNAQSQSEMTDGDRLIGYVAYYMSRGKTVISPVDGALIFTGLVYDYWGYHQNFLGFWQQLQQRKDFANLYLEEDACAFSQFLGGDYTVSRCARCRLPIPTPSGKAYTTPSCTLCYDQLLSETLSAPESTQVSVQPSMTHVIAIGKLPDNSEDLQQWLKVNGFKVSFVSHPDEITTDSLPDDVNLVLIVEEISEVQGEAWVQLLRHYAQLRQTPIIALSSKAGCGQTWLDGILSIEDYLITPLNGDRLAHHLQHLTKLNSVASEPCWFPFYG